MLGVGGYWSSFANDFTDTIAEGDLANIFLGDSLGKKKGEK
jgi:hypothetical protein